MPATPHATPQSEPAQHSAYAGCSAHSAPRRLLAVAAVTLAVAAATPAAVAYAAPSASISPSTVAPGGRVGLNVEGCGTKTGRATSSAFGEVQLTPGNLEATNLFGNATVHRNAGAGTHRVTFECGGAGGQRVTANLYVSPGAARGGEGGSIGSMSPAQIAMGGALVVGALGAGVWVIRRRAASV
ncbi:MULTISPECIES: hypothetical protein [Streptomyces]|uniref:hypothetical protein n=1 Tax=Streptomyces TaxID=1883 RepID=UPI0022707046|nr:MULTISPECIES: hypothetical protein [unclassified Streptomyces]MCY0942487.1 hypothetical protein [Streptomyces sp. H34-AA3]MCZ4083947.1 hypothetical protein [Streptomyces sp. H34-S5]